MMRRRRKKRKKKKKGTRPRDNLIVDRKLIVCDRCVGIGDVVQGHDLCYKMKKNAEAKAKELKRGEKGKEETASAATMKNKTKWRKLEEGKTSKKRLG